MVKEVQETKTMAKAETRTMEKAAREAEKEKVVIQRTRTPQTGVPSLGPDAVAVVKDVQMIHGAAIATTEARVSSAFTKSKIRGSMITALHKSEHASATHLEII